MREAERFIPPESERRIITLADVMDPSREVPEVYRALILEQEQDVRDFSTEFENAWGKIERLESLDPNTFVFFRERLANSVLVDLGCGSQFDDFDFPTQRSSFVKKLARYFGVATYIGVERYNLGKPEDRKIPPNPLVPFRETDEEGLHAIDVKSDMLDFVAHMRDNSANFILNGIDSFIIPSQEYYEALAQELSRATRPSGTVFGYNSKVDYILRHGLSNIQLKKRPSKLHNTFFVFEKQEPEDK